MNDGKPTVAETCLCKDCYANTRAIYYQVATPSGLS